MDALPPNLPVNSYISTSLDALPSYVDTSVSINTYHQILQSSS